MFFFFFRNDKAIAYSSFTTKVSKKQIKEIGFKNWIVDTGCYQNLLSALPKDNNSILNITFENIRLEDDGLTNKCTQLNSITTFNELPNMLFDVLSGHNKNRPRLDFIIDKSEAAGIVIPNINVLGESTEKIISIYERCINKGIYICVLDNTTPTGVSKYSLSDLNGTPYPKEKQLEIVNTLASLSPVDEKAQIRDLRGTTKRALGADFWTAYFLYEVTMEIPENFAYIIAGMARSTFILKCQEIEDNYNKLCFRIGTSFYTYQELLEKSLSSKSLKIDDFYDIPKRVGALPKSEKYTFADLREHFRKAYDDSASKKCIDPQNTLDTCCDQLGFKKMTYFNYRRYCAKMDEPGTKGLYKYYHYNQPVIDSVNTYIEKMKNVAELMHTTFSEREAKEMLLNFYKLDIKA